MAGEVQVLVGQAPSEIYFVAFTVAEKEALLKACNEHFGGSGDIEISDDDDDDDDDDSDRGAKLPDDDDGGDDGDGDGGHGGDNNDEYYLRKRRFITREMAPITGGIAQPLKREQQEEVERIWDTYDGSVSGPNGKLGLGYDVLDERKSGAVVAELPIGARGGLVPILGEHIDRMIPQRWLFDEVVNCYMALLQIRTDRRRTLGELIGSGKDIRAPSHFWGSFYIEKLRDCRSAARKAQMERMTKKITSAQGNIFQLDKMIMPVNIAGGHWALIVAYMKEQKLRSFTR